MILINRQVNNHYSMGGTHFLQTGYLLLNRNAPYEKFQSTLPRGGRQIQVLFPDQIVHFNPRSHEGSDICQPASALPNPISIHAPTRGATFCSNFFPPYEKFQSTLPRGERQKCRHQSKMSGNFNPRSHEGSDRIVAAGCSTNTDFNPRSHEGSDM